MLDSGPQVHVEEEDQVVRHVVDPKVVKAAEQVLQQVKQELQGGEDEKGVSGKTEPALSTDAGTDGGTLAWLLRQFGLARHTSRLESADLDLEQLLRVRLCPTTARSCSQICT